MFSSHKILFYFRTNCADLDEKFKYRILARFLASCKNFLRKQNSCKKLTTSSLEETKTVWTDTIRQFEPDQEGPCHQYCVETQGCKYFEFEHKTGRCELHNQEITKSNGYPGVKCYKMVSGNLSFVSILGLIT